MFGREHNGHTISLRPQVKSGKTPLTFSYISEKVFFDLFLFTCPFDCSDIRHIDNDDDDDYRLYVTLFVGVNRILLPSDIRAETEETVEN